MPLRMGRVWRRLGGRPQRTEKHRRTGIPIGPLLLAIAVVAGVSFATIVETALGMLWIALLVGLVGLAALLAWAAR